MEYKVKILIILVISIVLSPSCKKFLEVDPPQDSLIPSTVFSNDELATSAILGIYSRMSSSGYASGDNLSISAICGLTSDEYKNYNLVGFEELYQDQITPENYIISSLWDAAYLNIYNANAAIEGLSAPNGVTPLVKTQLQGEALFIRAFNYFYLVNLFGPVPLHLTTDYKKNSTATRTPINDIYQQILLDLKLSETMLNDNYISVERTRPNKATVEALLARVYLYIQDWPNAEKYATLVINKNKIYQLVNLDSVFLLNSEETIWQLMPAADTNSPNGFLLILTGIPQYVSLRPSFVLDAFETGDQRKTSWIQTYKDATGEYYYPFKYKVKSSTKVTEYSMVFRLAEQYLIRAEARTNSNNVSGALDDINLIRHRAGLTDIKNTIDQAQLLDDIQNERYVELFSEWGHRWFDLKRNNKAAAILSSIKTKWKNSAVLFPIPKTEIDRNKKIIQNPGY